jgi:hypothetical protein
MAFALTPGQRHEQTAFRELMSSGAVKRPGRGRPKVRPRTVVGDKGYTGRPVRARRDPDVALKTAPSILRQKFMTKCRG